MQKNVTTVMHENKIYAILISADFQQEGIEFFTPSNFSQQLGYMNRKKGYQIQPHIHKIVDRHVELTQEVLYIKSGRVRVDFFDEIHIFIKSIEVCAGDILLLSFGGHGFTMLEDSEIIEVKQGPYVGEEDKERFIPNTINE